MSQADAELQLWFPFAHPWAIGTLLQRGEMALEPEQQRLTSLTHKDGAGKYITQALVSPLRETSGLTELRQDREVGE